MLIAKEWLSFGHRFKERIGHTMLPGAKRSDHISPVFLQWLDCVWQLVSKFPCHFEFNTRMLLAIADNLFSWCVACRVCTGAGAILNHALACSRFGTFLANCERERRSAHHHAKTRSVFAYLLERRNLFTSPFYNSQVQ